MNILKSWVYVDDNNNIWKFSVNSDKKLQYSIMYKEVKTTKEILIDQDVLGHYIYADKDGIHIIYSNTKEELKYCTFIEQQWMGKTLYKLDNKKVEIINLNVLLISNVMHIFYLLMDKESNGHGVLMHCKWNGEETKVDKLQDVVLASALNEHYLVYLDENDDIEMLIFSDEGNEISLNHCSYKNKRWTHVTRLYGILGDDIEFKMLKNQYGIHVINKCKENSVYYLVHVFVKKSGAVYKSNVHESVNALTEPILLKKNNKVYSYWLEENKIYSSFFNGKKWSSPICFVENNEQEVKKYNYVDFNNDYNNKIREVYGIGDLDLNLIIPGETGQKDKEQLMQTEKNLEIIDEKELLLIDRDIKKLKSELFSFKSDNKVMEQAIASLNLQLQNKQKIKEEYEEQISKMNNYKKKTEENYNILMEVQQKLQNEIAEIKRLYAEEKVYRENIEMKLKESEEEKINIKEQFEKLMEENIRLGKELEIEKNRSALKRFWMH